MAIIETSRLRLRPPQASDAKPFMEIHEDPRVISRVVMEGPTTGITGAWGNIATMIGHWHLRGYGQWAVVEKASNAVIGRVGLWHPEGVPDIELGWIIRRARWNHGFASEAARRALEWTWENVAWDHVISPIEPGNLASIRVAEKIGESFERTDLKKAVHMYGVRRPV